MPIIARHLMIFGRVQGVYYRNWMVATARDLGVAGWVRNRADGCVEVQVEGEVQAVEQLIQRAHEGPATAKVVRIDVMDMTPQALDGFHKLPTV